ncbi:hypothetical protein GYMLUDRAFT_236056 [Collybiopsis luxurians FD-317 M1]|nr:hypothetical protein GYMLUDRAFT_236056 [Collybiopsis luxurians FD-317 M1]
MLMFYLVLSTLPSTHRNRGPSAGEQGNYASISLTYRVLRCCCSVVLLLCSLASTVFADCDIPYNLASRQILNCIAYVGVVSDFAQTSTITEFLCRGILFSWRLAQFLLASLALYGYTTLIPTILSTASSRNVCESKIQLWSEGLALVLGAVLLPLLVPRRYVPFDSKNPLSNPNPEQTASLLSLLFFSYLDPIIFKASKVPHLSTDELPFLSEEDQARVLREKDLGKLDPLARGGKQHLFFNLLRTFAKDISGMTIALLCHAMFSFLPTIATNQLLAYLEATPSGSDRVPPWFWISLLFIGPVGSSAAIEVYMRVVLRALVITEALLAELIYEHAVKARVKSDARDEDSIEAEKTMANINTLVTVDLNTLEQGQHFLVLIIYLPIQMMICIAFLYRLLGWSAFVGIALTALLVPIPSLVGKLFHGVQEDKMKKTDSRVQMFTDGNVSLVRSAFIEFADDISSTLIAKGEFSASVAFPALVVFDLFRNQIQVAFFHGTRIITAKVSLDRINTFLHNTELLDGFDANSVSPVSNGEISDKIGFHNASFTWSNSASGSATPLGRRFVLRIPETLQFKRNAVNLVVGATGSGKSSLILALLGELHYTPLSGDAWFNLPRAGGVAYAAQESWVLNETIKDNILFGSPYDEDRYKKVIKQCALEPDLALFAAGDMTEIGERGLTLSGGQKVRLTLARAIYSQAEILLLDDILAALDVHTSNWIVEECLSGDLVKGRTVIMVSHNVALLTPLARTFTKLKDGVATLSDNAEEYIQNGRDVLPRVVQDTDAEVMEKRDDSSDGKIILSEEIHQGTGVGWPAIKLYATSLGGKHPFLFFTTFFAGLLISHLTGVVQIWYLGHWASEYEHHTPTEVPALHHLAFYGNILVNARSICSESRLDDLRAYFLNLADRSLLRPCAIHFCIAEGVTNDSQSTGGIGPCGDIQASQNSLNIWLDETPISRIITRSTQDIGSVDLALPMLTSRVCDLSIRLLFQIAAIIVFTPAFLLPSIILICLGVWVGSVYLKAQSSVKREMSNAKAPVVGLIGAVSTGVVSLRAYSAQAQFAETLMTRIDHYSRSARIFYNLQRWMAMRTETLAGLFCASLAGYLVYFTNSSASDIGFLLNLAVAFSGSLVWYLIAVNDFEAESNCLERLESYLRIDQEAHLGDGSLPPAQWPSSGELRVENLTAKYSFDGPEVLHGLSFHIKSGERIGVVGRTGSGKSTLTLALLRCILTTGRVFYDDILISTLNLDALRSQITIIPQMPELISGSLRQNLDPFEEYDDQVLNDALRSAGLASLQEELDVQDRVGLDTLIASGGTNLSVGQRQILNLARAIVRGSKLLILDEATSAIDYKTDNIIQQSLRNEYLERGGDTTIITIAHRLQTVMDMDRIMVLDAGQMVEFDSPAALLRKEDGQFRSMVECASDKQALLALVKDL